MHTNAPEHHPAPSSGVTHDATSNESTSSAMRAPGRRLGWAARRGQLRQVQRAAGNRAAVALLRRDTPQSRDAPSLTPADEPAIEAGQPIHDAASPTRDLGTATPPPGGADDASGNTGIGTGDADGRRASGGDAPPPPVQREDDPPAPPPAPSGSKAPPAPPPPPAAPSPPGDGQVPGDAGPDQGSTPQAGGPGGGPTEATPTPDGGDTKAGDAKADDAPGGGTGAGEATPGDAGDGGPGGPMSPAEAAAHAEGPRAPDAEGGYTTNAQIQPPADPAVAKLFEQRKDPQAEAVHKKLMAQGAALRIDAQGYKYKPGGFGNALLSLVNPVPGIVEGWDRIFGDNMYSSGEGVVASIQSGIDRYRGYLKICSEVAGWVSMAATVVAVIAALTIVGAPVAAVAFKVSVVAALVQAGVKAFDALLGVVQLLINIARARSTDDPVERARLVMQIKGESGMFADSLTGAVIDAALAGTGGVGKAGAATAKNVAKLGIKQGLRKSVKGLFRRAAALKRLARIKTGKLAKVAGRMTNVAAVARLARIKVKTSIPGSQLWQSAKKAEYTAKLAEKIKGFRAHARLKYSPGNWVERAKSTAGKSAEALGVNTGKGAAKKATEKGMGIEGGIKGSGESAPDAGGGPDIGLTYTKVAYWPSILAEMGTVRTNIGTAQASVRTHYDKAAEDAGEKRKVIEGLQGAPSKAGTRMSMTGGSQQAAAEAGKQQSKEAEKTAEKATEKKTAASGKMAEAEKGAKDASEATDKAEASEKGKADAKKSDGGWWDTITDAARAVYDATLGKLFKGLNQVKGWISKSVMKLAMAAAGLDQDDMDLAGIKSEAQADAEADDKARADAGEVKDKGSEFDTQVANAKKGASAQEQTAMQAMVDAGSYIRALDEYDQALAEEQDHGTNYITNATEAVGAAADAPLVTAAYVQPIVDGAAWLQGEAAAFPAKLAEHGAAAGSGLTAGIAANGVDGSLAGAVAQTIVDEWVAAARELSGAMATKAATLSAAAARSVGSDWFIYVDEQLAAQLEQLADTFDSFAGAAATGISGALHEMASLHVSVAALLDQEGADIDKDAATAEPPDDPDDASGPGTPDAGAPAAGTPDAGAPVPAAP